MGGPQVRIPSSVCLHVNQDGSKGTAARSKKISSDFRPRSEEVRPANKTKKNEGRRERARERDRERKRERERQREREREKEIRFAKSDERSETGTENKHAGSGC